MKPSGVGSVPNAARIRGRCPEGAPASGPWKVHVDAADDTEGQPNFAKDYVGKTIELTVSGSGPALAPNEPFEAVVSFRGDERGGSFVTRGAIEKPRSPKR
jgi:hypothetical protein